MLTLSFEVQVEHMDSSFLFQSSGASQRNWAQEFAHGPNGIAVASLRGLPLGPMLLLHSPAGILLKVGSAGKPKSFILH